MLNHIQENAVKILNKFRYLIMRSEIPLKLGEIAVGRWSYTEFSQKVLILEEASEQEFKSYLDFIRSFGGYVVDDGLGEYFYKILID